MLLSMISQAGSMNPFDMVAMVLGKVIEWIYEILTLVGIHNAALSIIIFTIIVYALMIPMNYKQQKSQKLMSVVQPEIQKITDKYKGKKDNASMVKQQTEMQAVYDKYGTTPTGGCLTSLLTMLIFIGLYRVIIYMHLYIPEINNLYSEVSKSIVDSGVNFKEILSKMADTTVGYKGTAHIDDINKVLYSLKPEQWTELAHKFAKSSNDCVAVINANSDKLIDIHRFIFGMNIKYAPKDVIWPGILIPILSLVTQLFSNHQITKKTMQNSGNDNPMMQSMMVTTKIMPFFSFFICLTMPIGAGIYWVLSGVLRIIQQAIFDKHFDKMDIDDMIKSNVNKASKKKKSYLQKLMEAQEEIEGNQSSAQKSLKDYAHINSRNYNESFENVDNEVGGGKEPKEGSISSYANIMKSSNRK